MKIGIITFHWGSNYGAILQAYALQEFLSKVGHEVHIINFKPKKYDFSFFKLLTSRLLLNPIKYFRNWKKELTLSRFRDKYLNTTIRYRSIGELKNNPPACDVYISGSDQVLNPYFTQYGEDGNLPSSAYFLDFGSKSVIRIGYAVSFGCTEYPELAKKLAQSLLKNFGKIGVREKTGESILASMDYHNFCIVPDPTILLKSTDYDKHTKEGKEKGKLTFIYMLRTDNEILNKLKKEVPNNIVADFKMSIGSWLSNIKNAKSVVTNSFHGVVFCLHYHIPFVVLLKTTENIGMNDRFFTLLEPMNLLKYIISESDLSSLKALLSEERHWDKVDKEIDRLKEIGSSFLENVISTPVYGV